MRENRFLVFIMGCVSLAWLLNLNFGIIEIPDNIPILGHLDEALALGVFIACLSYFGVDLRPWFDRVSNFFKKMSEAENPTASAEKRTSQTKDQVVEVEAEKVETTSDQATG